MISRPQRAKPGRNQSYQVESLESRQLLTATLVQPINNVTFAQDSGPETVDLYTLFADSTRSADLNFTVTSSAPSIVSTSILGNNLTLTPAAGRSGYTLIKMVAADPSGGRVINTFRVQITALPARSLDVTLDAKHRSVTFTQIDHASATISLSGPGTAVVHFGGDGLKLSGAVLNGTRTEMESVTLSNTNGKSHLSIVGARSGSGQAMIGNITVDKSVGSIDVHKALLIGDIQASAAINTLNFDTAESGQISIGSGSTRMNMGTAVDEVFFSQGSVSSLNATQWIDSDNVPESFVASAVRGMNVKGNFIPNFEVTGTGVKGRALDHVKVRGEVLGEWFAQGSTGSVDIGFVGPTWQGQFKAVSSLTFEGDLNRPLTAESIHQLKIRGKLSFCTVQLTGTGNALGSMSLGTGDSFLMFSTGSIGSITSAYITNSLIWAGLGSDLSHGGLPTSASGFLTNARIGSIRLRPGTATGFTGTNIAAARLGNLSMTSTNSKNNGGKFGLAALNIDSLSMKDRGRPQTFSLRKIKTAAALQAAIASHKWVLGDLTFSIL